MDELLKALYSKFSGSSVSSDVGGRHFLDQAPDGCDFPYIVYSVVSAPKEKTFTEIYRNTLIQFSIFSTSQSVLEITGIYNDLSALFDECSLTVTGSSLVWMKEENLVTMTEDVTDPNGISQRVRHWAVDYEIRTSLQ